MRVLVFGNGFDLDLGLNTRYSDFAKSKEWIELFERKNDNDNCLSSYLYKKSKVDDWFNIEKSLKSVKKKIKKLQKGSFMTGVGLTKNKKDPIIIKEINI